MSFIIIAIIVTAAIVLVRRSRSGDQPRTVKTPAVRGNEVQNAIIPQGGIPHRLAPVGRVGVAGEQYHKDAIRAAIGAGIRQVKPVGQWGRSLKVFAELRRQPYNTFDKNAIAVVINGQHVGYIPADKTHLWQPLLQSLESRGMFAVVEAEVYSSHGDGFGIVIDASPNAPDMVNAKPEGMVLEPQWTVSVSGEENAQETLKPYVGRFIWVALKTGTIPSKYQVQGRSYGLGPRGWEGSGVSDHHAVRTLLHPRETTSALLLRRSGQPRSKETRYSCRCPP